MGQERIHIKITQDGAKATRRDIEGLGEGADGAANALKGLAGTLKGIVAAAAVRETIQLADAYTDLSNKIRFATRSEQEMVSVRAELLRVANANRSTVEDTADVYSKLRLSTQRLGLSQREVIDLTDTLQKATALSGASSESAANALRQLGQGMAAGALRGDELNSVLENTPYIAKVIADSLGKDIGTIRQMGAEGKITGKIIYDAFKGAREEIAEKFSKSIPTVSASLNVLKNAATSLVGEVNEATGASASLSSAIVDIANSVTKAIPDIRILMKTLQGFDELERHEGIIERIFHGIVGEDNDGIGALRSWSVMLAAIQDQVYFTVRAVEKLGGALAHPLDSSWADVAQALGTDFTNTAGPAQQRLMQEFAKADQLRLGKGFGRAPGTAAPVDALDEKPNVAADTSNFNDLMTSLKREGELLKLNNDERAIAKDLDEAKKKLGASITEEQTRAVEAQVRANHELEKANQEEKSHHKTVRDILQDLEREHSLMRMSNDERAIAEGLQKAQDALNGKMTSAQRELVETQLRRNQALEVEARLLDEVNQRIDDQLQVELDLMAVEQKRREEAGVAAGKRAAEVAAIGAAERQKAVDRTFDGSITIMSKEFLENTRTVGQELAAIFGPGGTLQRGLEGVVGSLSDVIGQSIAFGRSWDDTVDAIKNVGRSILAEIISSLIKIPIQMGINAAIASGLRAKETAETVAQAGAITTAMAPAAAATSLATAGTNVSGATAAIIGVAALATGVLAGAALFEDGGYTGNSPRGAVAGLVHGQEYVLNADATRRYRVQLDAMNAGTWRPGGGGSVQVTIVNQAPGVEFETRQVDDTHIEVIARRVAAAVAPEAVAQDLRSPQSRVGKALVQTTSARRVRT